MKQENSNSGGSVAKTVVALYLAFFLVWCAGAAIGELWPGAEQPSLWGLPLWFVVGCVASFIAVSIALIRIVRGWLK